MTHAKPTLAVVGATGAVGTVMLQILSEREDVWGEIRLVASRRSAGKKLDGARRGGRGPARWRRRSSTASTSRCSTCPTRSPREWAPIAAARGAVVVDNSGAFRMDADVPLVVPEVNPRRRPQPAARDHRQPELHDAVDDRRARRAAPEYGLQELVVASLPGRVRRRSARHRHAARPAREGRRRPQRSAPQAGDVRRAVGDDLGPFPAPLALNVVPWAGSLKDDGWSSEELKVRNESRKILGLPDLRVSATCVRVPVVTTHSLAVHAVFDREVEPGRGAGRSWAARPASCWSTTRPTGEFPTPADVVGTDPTWVGRVRRGARRPERARPVPLRRQPAQGRRAEHRPDRRAGRRRVLTPAGGRADKPDCSGWRAVTGRGTGR